jgi:Flp pilus assembly protein TadG
MLVRTRYSARRRALRRTAAALVETAAVVSVFCMLLFGVVEFCRFIFMRQLIDNAAREGARYAICHSYDATADTDTQNVVRAKMGGMDQKVRNFTINLYHADSSGNRVTAYDSSGGSQIATFSDATGTYLQTQSGTKLYTAKDATGTYVQDPSNGNSKVYVNTNSYTNTVTGVNSGTFNSFVTNNQIQGVDDIANTSFGQYVAVDISCDYDPITPAMLRLGQTIKIRTKILMYSEAN